MKVATYIIFTLAISHGCIGMEQLPFTYARDILPHMPVGAPITILGGQSILQRLPEVCFETVNPEWKFEHAFDWARENLNKPDKQVDLAILKRFIALHIARSGQRELETIKDEILANAQDKRWVVLGDTNAQVSSQQIDERWYQFTVHLAWYAPLVELLNAE